ncbi:suppressor of fused domain protein [Angustibacter luteus]|uniref:Suppressor of fused domain protein n=1 Tax=Angustibacter luteus TaxID=658456 RepID=A0ABW1JGQ3_9ACTN
MFRRQRDPDPTGDVVEPSTRGWDAVDAACRGLYGDQVPKHVGYFPGRDFGSALQGCSAYRVDDYWHYVTYGLSNIFDDDEGDNEGLSGWGYELTWRVRDDSAEPGAAPAWPFTILQRIAQWASEKPLLLDPHVRLPLGGPVTGHPDTGGPDTPLTVIALVEDPTLRRISTPNGLVQFLQFVAVTEHDWKVMQDTDTQQVLDGMRAVDGLLITNVG